MRYTLGAPLPLHLQFLHTSSPLFGHGFVADSGKRICIVSSATPSRSSPASSRNQSSNATSSPPSFARPHSLVKPPPQRSRCYRAPTGLSPPLNPVGCGWPWSSHNRTRGGTKGDRWRHEGPVSMVTTGRMQGRVLHGRTLDSTRSSMAMCHAGF